MAHVDWHSLAVQWAHPSFSRQAVHVVSVEQSTMATAVGGGDVVIALVAASIAASIVKSVSM